MHSLSVVQIYVGVIWKSDVNMPFVVISTNRKAVFEDFYRSQNLKCCPISKSPVVFLVYMFVTHKDRHFKPSFVKIGPVVAKLWLFQIPDFPPFFIPRWPPEKTPFSTLFHG
jgi:hypothetical protein